MNRIAVNPQYTEARYNKAEDAANRYIENIRKQTGQVKGRKIAENLWWNGDARESNEISRELNTKQYSRNTYMGNSNG